jgi:putative endonuclease
MLPRRGNEVRTQRSKRNGDDQPLKGKNREQGHRRDAEGAEFRGEDVRNLEKIFRWLPEMKRGSHEIFVYTRTSGSAPQVSTAACEAGFFAAKLGNFWQERHVPIFSSLIFGAVRWAARKGLRGEREDFSTEPELPKPTNAAQRMAARKLEAGRTGLRGETYAYWYLRRKGYVFVARNYIPRGAKGEIDLIGYDGKTLAFVEVRTRTVSDVMTALPELSVTTDKQRVVVRTARRFLGERHVGDCPCRFHVLAIDNRPGMPPEVRLHKDAFSPQMS